MLAAVDFTRKSVKAWSAAGRIKHHRLIKEAFAKPRLQRHAAVAPICRCRDLIKGSLCHYGSRLQRDILHPIAQKIWLASRNASQRTSHCQIDLIQRHQDCNMT